MREVTANFVICVKLYGQLKWLYIRTINDLVYAWALINVWFCSSFYTET